MNLIKLNTITLGLALALGTSGCIAGTADTITEEEAFQKVAATIENGQSMKSEAEEIINQEPCYVIAVGDNKPDQFVVTGRYAVGKQSGKIYRYDIVMDAYSEIK